MKSTVFARTTVRLSYLVSLNITMHKSKIKLKSEDSFSEFNFSPVFSFTLVHSEKSPRRALAFDKQISCIKCHRVSSGLYLGPVSTHHFFLKCKSVQKVLSPSTENTVQQIKKVADTKGVSTLRVLKCIDFVLKKIYSKG